MATGNSSTRHHILRLRIHLTAVYGDQTDPEYSAYIDRPRHEVKINYCPTRDYDGQEIPANLIWKAVQEDDSRLREINTMCDARWIHRDRLEQGSRRGTVVVAFASAELAQTVLRAGKSVACGEMVTFERYEKRPMIKYCAWCGSLGHTTARCQKPKCMRCASDGHTTESHPENMLEKCINCGGAHEARSRECAKRLSKLGTRKPNKSEVGAGPKPKPHKAATVKPALVGTVIEGAERSGDPDWANAADTDWSRESAHATVMPSLPTIKIQKRPKIKSPAKNSTPDSDANAQAMDIESG